MNGVGAVGGLNPGTGDLTGVVITDPMPAGGPTGRHGELTLPPGFESDEALAAKTDDGRPVENGLRNMWVTETALTTALNTSFFAERVAYFSIVMGVALLLTGIGFLVLTLGGALGAVAVAKREKALKTASAAT